MFENNSTVKTVSTLDSVKKWRTDYSSLLKCWSLIKSSELIKDIAYKELKKFKAEDKALHRLSGFIERNQNKSSFEQTISLWNKAIEQFVYQKNFFAAADCMENLAELEFKYGSTDDKRESLQTLIRASKYFKKASDHKRAIIALKRVLTIIEFSPKNDITSIVDKYEQCGHLYEALDLTHLAKINTKIAKFLDEEKQFINTNKSKPPTSEQTIASRVSTPSTLAMNNSESESDGIQSDCDDKEVVRQQIKLMEQSMPMSIASASAQESDSDSSDDNMEDIKSMTKHKSKELLRKNLRNILLNSNEHKIEAKIVVKTEKHSQKRMTTEITAVQSQSPEPVEPKQGSSQSPTPAKRKRRPKAKEESEELPEKRLNKLQKLSFVHNYIIDPKEPLERLYCKLCCESILSYRWSIVTDHLESKKHKEFTTRAINQRLTEELMARNVEDFSYYEEYNDCSNSAFNTNCMSVMSSSGAFLGQFVVDTNQMQQKSAPTELVPVLSNTGNCEQDWPQTRITSLDSLFLPSPSGAQYGPINDQQNCNEVSAKNTYQSLDTPPILNSASNPFQSAFQQN